MILTSIRSSNFNPYIGLTWSGRISKISRCRKPHFSLDAVISTTWPFKAYWLAASKLWWNRPSKHENKMLAFSRRTGHAILTGQTRSQMCLRRRCIHASNFRLQVTSPRREETGGPHKDSTRTSSRPRTDPSPNASGSEKDQPLPSLSRPLGVRHRPSTLEITRAQRLKDLMDHETRMAQRRHLWVTSDNGTGMLDSPCTPQDQGGREGLFPWYEHDTPTWR